MIDRVLLQAIEAAQFELELYDMSGHRSVEQTLERLLQILTDPDVVGALDEIGRPGNVIPLYVVKPVAASEPDHQTPSRRNGLL